MTGVGGGGDEKARQDELSRKTKPGRPDEPPRDEEAAPRPADLARRALRAARERREGASGANASQVGASSEGPDAPDASADVPEASDGDGPKARPATPLASGEDGDRSRTASESASGVLGIETGPGGSRPADAARAALRAALGERRRAQSEEADRAAQGPRRSRRTAPSGAEGRRSPAGGTENQRALEVRRWLAGAFQMPPADSPDEDVSGIGAMPDPTAQRRKMPTAPSSRSRSTPSSPVLPDKDSPEPPVARSGVDPSPADPADPAPDPADPAPDPADPAPDPADPAPDPADPDPAPGPAAVATPAAPATPQVPRSMAAPARDGELRRTFPAFGPRPADDARFAETWWGNAWVTALEEGALDPKRLARGRGYAQEGHVDAITVTPGLVLAYVRGSRPRPYRVQVRLRTLEDADWARFLDAVAERPGHIAALLDKEMPQSLADCGVPLLPGPGELDPHCSCPDRGHPCKHAAALCYQTARLLDADPFVLLLLRGRGERALLDALSRRNAARAARAAQEKAPAPPAGVRATDALAPDRRLPPLPAPLPVPPHPEQPPVYPAAPGGPDPFALDQLATDAAARAHALLGTGRDPVAELTLWQDAVRLAAARPGSGLTAGTRALYSSLSAAADRTPAELARAVAAWRQGGLEGLAVLEESWDPPAGRFDRARPLLLAADLPAFRPWRNHLTHPRGHVQIRLGRDGLWYPYESEPGHDDWWPRGTPDLDPVGALTGLGASPEG
ncbi:SWIM zinc finger family protein [Streptomyces sp. NPDC012935]|uniref:SWIM zinc finger family protein n=1 Tax=Streptomyces sp. NPDC012935 TaxID=3364857 RepID=UPI0036A7C884